MPGERVSVDAEGSHHHTRAMPLGPPSDPSRFDTFDECVAALSDDPDVDDPEAVCGAWKSETENDAPMTDTTTDPQYRAVYQPTPDQVSLRDIEAEEDGLFAVRMPIASTGEVRNEGDEPLTRDELAGMATQINDGDVGVFLSHGRSFEISDARYGQTERLGSWQDAEVTTPEDRDDGTDDDLLVSTAVMADPETLPAATGRYRETLAILKEQADRGIPMSSSIGWRDDENAPGGNDLMEASIVGIPADPRTNNTKAMARAAVDAGADPEAFVDAVRDAVMGATDDTEHEHDMTDTEDDDPPETVEHEGRTYVLRTEDGDTTDDESAERQDAPEWAADMLELLRETNQTLGELAEEIRQDDDEDEDDDEEDNETDEDDDEDDEEENAAEQAADLHDHLTALREGGIDVSDVELPDADGEQDTDDGEGDTATPPEDAFKKRLR